MVKCSNCGGVLMFVVPGEIGRCLNCGMENHLRGAAQMVDESHNSGSTS